MAVPALPGDRAWRTAPSRRSTGAPTTARSPASRSSAPERRCWRCGELVEKRDLDQWYLKTTDYADELLASRASTGPSRSSIQQTNWIGRSEGAEIVFETAPSDHHPGGDDRCASSRPAPTRCSGRRSWCSLRSTRSSPSLTAPDRRAEVDAYVAQARRRTEIDRLSTDREKTGVAIGADAVNPVNGERIPIFVADYVLGGYGTGAIMAVPAHDERDFAFARQFGLPIRRVVAAPGTEAGDPMDGRLRRARRRRAAGQQRRVRRACPPTRAARRSSRGWPKRARPSRKVTYRLRDWLISRQRYWGTPIPVVYCERDGIVPVPDEDLPVRLPEDVDYHGSGTNPLTKDEAFLNIACPICGGAGPARDRHDGHVRRLVVVLVSLPVAATRRTARSTASWPTAGRRSTSTRAAPSTP